MEKLPIADAHTDYLMNLREKSCKLSDGIDGQKHISLDALRQGNVKLQVFAAFAGDAKKSSAAVQTLASINWYYAMLDGWGRECIAPVTGIGSLSRIESDEEIGALLSIEGGEACAGSLEVLGAFKRLGVCILTLVWNLENEIGYPSNLACAAKNKLKPFGRRCVDYMCRNNIAVDVSHLNPGGFYDAIRIASKPVMASHSNAYALCPHPRNLADDQIRAIIESGGFIGLNFFPKFLTCEKRCGIDDIVAHARHILSLGGEDALGFGSDFDGIPATPDGVLGAQSYPAIVRALDQAGIGRELLEKICFRNFLCYIGRFLPDA